MMLEYERDLREKLEDEAGPADWKALRAHFLRGAIIVVAPDLDLIDVGVKVAKDDTQQVGQWISDGKLTKPTPRDAEAWEKGAVELLSIIVSPYVLVQRRNQS